ncbi:hypothetical protein, partial [Pseudomonas aeruginosa]|uniref:hypothetical protein n=1 Tax=Pseudomonas aeruginosa TaxID=287 RepID=UPI003EBCC508
GGVQPVEVPIHRSQNGIDQASQGTQRVIVRDALLQRRITEQLVLFEVESTHRLGLASAEEDGRHFARATRALAFFNGLLGKPPGASMADEQGCLRPFSLAPIRPSGNDL